MSDPIPAPCTQAERINDIRAVMDHAGSERATLFGVSDGAAMSLLFAATFPDRVESLVLHSPFPCMLKKDDYPYGRTREFLDTYCEALISTWGTGEGCDFPNPSLTGDDRYREWFARYTRIAASPSMVADLVKLNIELDIRSVLPSVTAPTLVTHRTDEVWVSVEQGRYVARSLPHATMAEFEGADHWPWIGNANEILDAVEEFVTGTRPRRRARSHAVGVDALSPRERQVLRLSIEGLTAAEIAASLGVGTRTVETHLSHGYQKLGVRSRIELVRRYRDAAV